MSRLALVRSGSSTSSVMRSFASTRPRAALWRGSRSVGARADWPSVTGRCGQRATSSRQSSGSIRGLTGLSTRFACGSGRGMSQSAQELCGWRVMPTRLALLAGIAALALLAGGCGGGKGVFRFGIVFDCEGVFSPITDQILAGAELPLLERGGRLVGHAPGDGVRGPKVAGRRVEIRAGCAEIGY